MKKYVIFGAGSFLSDIFDIIHANEGRVIEICHNAPEAYSERTIPVKQRIALLGYEVKFYTSLDEFKPKDDYEYVIGCAIVKKYHLVEELKKRFKIKFCKLIHPQAYLGSNVYVGEGAIIGPGAVIAPNAYLDDFCLINRVVSVGHDARIGKYTRIGPAATIAGLSKIGDKTSIYMNSSVLDSVYVGDWSVVGAGAVVNKDIPDGVIAVGVPAKIIRKNNERDD